MVATCERVAVGNEAAGTGAGAPCPVARRPGDRRAGRGADPHKRTRARPEGRSHPHPCACYRRGTSVFRNNNNPHGWGGFGEIESRRRGRCGDHGRGHAAACKTVRNLYVSTPTLCPRAQKGARTAYLTAGLTSIRESYLPRGEPRVAGPTRGCASAGACLGPRPLRCACRTGGCRDCTRTLCATTSASEPRCPLRNTLLATTTFATNCAFNELHFPRKRTAPLPGRPTIHKPFVI